MDAVTPFEALKAAAEILGSQSALARVCSLSQPSVWKWFQSSKRLPAEHVLTVESASGVSRHLLRPDIYPLEIGADAPVLPSLSGDDSNVSCDRRAISHGGAAA